MGKYMVIRALQIIIQKKCVIQKKKSYICNVICGFNDDVRQSPKKVLISQFGLRNINKNKPFK